VGLLRVCPLILGNFQRETTLYKTGVLCLGQVEVLEVLVNSGKWMTSSEIYEKVKDKMGRCSVTNCLDRLSFHQEIERKKAPELKFGYVYKVKENGQEN